MKSEMFCCRLREASFIFAVVLLPHLAFGLVVNKPPKRSEECEFIGLASVLVTTNYMEIIVLFQCYNRVFQFTSKHAFLVQSETH